MVKESHSPILRHYHKVLAKGKYTDQWNRTKSSQTDPYKYDHLISDKGTKAIQWPGVSFSTNGTGTTGYTSKGKTMNPNLNLTQKLTQNVIDLNEKQKLLEKREKIWDTGLGEKVLDMTPKA